MKTLDPGRFKWMALKNCPACGQSPRKVMFVLKSSTVFQCQPCGLRYLDPCLSPESMANAYESDKSLTEFHDFHEGYYEYGSLKKKSKTRADFEKGLELASKPLPSEPQKKILDVGFGNGFFLAVAQAKGWKVQGMDTSAANVEKARAKFGLELLCGSFEKEIPDRAEFDTVSFWDVLEHLPDPHAVLQKARRVLKPHGTLLIGLPNDQNLLMIISSILYKMSFGTFPFGIHKLYFLEHVAYYRPESLDRLLKKNGFRLRESFLTNTDLAKYNLPLWEKLTAGTLLQLGHWLKLSNRLVAVYQIQ